jgi:NADH:ubiquinone oxidoreductase subunit 6 (subunit J)
MFEGFANEDWLGLIGFIFLALGYILAQLKVIKVDNLLYPLLNLAGVAMMLYALSINYNLPVVIIEFIWMIIAIYAVFIFITNGLSSKKKDK